MEDKSSHGQILKQQIMEGFVAKRVVLSKCREAAREAKTAVGERRNLASQSISQYLRARKVPMHGCFAACVGGCFKYISEAEINPDKLCVGRW